MYEGKKMLLKRSHNEYILHDTINQLMEKKTSEANRKPNQTHHHPSIPIKPRRLTFDPVLEKRCKSLKLFAF